jgi:hypothetical protein
MRRRLFTLLSAVSLVLCAATCNVESRVMRQNEVPAEYHDYPCEDYFAEGWSIRGYRDEASQTMVVTPLPEAYEVGEAEFLAVGRSGCGGIDFGYRKGKAGLWAYYPIEREFKYMAVTVARLVDGWCSGRLSV